MGPLVCNWTTSLIFRYRLFRCFIGTASAEAIATEKARPKEAIAQDAACGSYWYEGITKQGISAFNPNPAGYQIYRNVKDFGAKGDGVTDDTAGNHLSKLREKIAALTLHSDQFCYQQWVPMCAGLMRVYNDDTGRSVLSCWYLSPLIINVSLFGTNFFPVP